jgi:hypothetical protein
MRAPHFVVVAVDERSTVAAGNLKRDSLQVAGTAGSLQAAGTAESLVEEGGTLRGAVVRIVGRSCCPRPSDHKLLEARTDEEAHTVERRKAAALGWRSHPHTRKAQA